MDTIWMGIAPGPQETRVIAMHGANETILKARLGKEPAHPRSLSSLLEAIALWQGLPVRAALAVSSPSSGYGTSFYHELALDFGRSPLYSLDFVRAEDRNRRRRRDLAGMGEFGDLRRLLISEVAR
jgi:hypothetical protein